MDNETRKEEMFENETNQELLDKAEEEARLIKVEDLENQAIDYGEEKDYERFQ